MCSLAKLNHQCIDSSKPHRVKRHTELYVFRQFFVEQIRVSVVPVPHNIAGELNMSIVAFGMHLLAQKMDKPVVAVRQFIHCCGNFAQFAFGSNLIKINRKNSCQLFDMLENWPDIGVKQGCYIALKQVGIRNKYPAKPQVNNERRQQIAESKRRIFNQLHPNAHIFNVVFVYCQLPVFADIHNTGRNKAMPDEQFLKMRNMEIIVSSENLFPQGKNTIENSALITFFQVAKEPENIVEKSENLITGEFIFYISQQIIKIAEQQLFLILHSFEVKQIEQVKELFMKAFETVMQLPYMQRNIIISGNGQQVIPGFSFLSL